MGASGPRAQRAGIVAVVVALGLLVACTGTSGPSTSDGGPADDGASAAEAALVRQGGDATVLEDGASAFAQPMPGLSSQERRDFAVGNSFFNQNWVTAPASTAARDGLGPLFNAASCSSCHFKDGRGQPPVDADDPERGLLVRLSVLDEDGTPQPHPTYGGQFQPTAPPTPWPRRPTPW